MFELMPKIDTSTEQIQQFFFDKRENASQSAENVNSAEAQLSKV